MENIGQKASLFIGALVIICIFVFTFITLNNRPNSTEGVVTVDDYTAQIHVGDTLILTSSCGKSCTHLWKVTWDGGDVVHIDDDGFLRSSHYSGTLCGIDCSVNIKTGLLSSGLDVTEKANEAVEVKWPFGWGYRRYSVSE